MKLITIIVFYIFTFVKKINTYCHNRYISIQLGGAKIQYPFNISGIYNIKAGANINIGKGSTIFCTRAPLIIKGHFVAGPNLTIMTGDHMPMIGKFIDTITDKDKDENDIKHLYDQQIIIEKDVWVGANVTILKGVTIGRGSIIAACSLVTKDVPAYSVVGGVPAKVLKYRLTKTQIQRHEEKLYPEEQRYSEEQITNIFES